MSNLYHLTAEEIARLPGTLNIHPVNPAARRTISSPGDATELTTLDVNVFVVATGDKSTEYHVHACEDEAVYVLSGTGTARAGDAKHEVRAGDFVCYLKCGPAHEIQNTGDGPLQLLVIGQRLSEDVIDYPDLNKRLYRCAGRTNDLIELAQVSDPSRARRRLGRPSGVFRGRSLLTVVGQSRHWAGSPALYSRSTPLA